MTEKEVTFQDKQGRKIVGTFLIPEGVGPFAAVIVCHGWRGDRSQPHIKMMAQELTKRSIAALSFDFTFDPGESSLPFPDMTVSYELEALDQAVNFLKDQPQINKAKIGLTGHSLGGLVVAWYAAAHPEIKAVAPLSAVYSFLQMWKHAYGDITKDLEEKGFAYTFSERLKRNLKIKEDFYKDAQQYEMDKVIDSLVCPLLVVAGTGDNIVTIDHAQHYYDRAFSKEKELHIVKGSDHNYSQPVHLEEVVETTAFWFSKVLG